MTYMPKRQKINCNMAAIHHLEFAKIAILVTWPISACYYSSCFFEYRINWPNGADIWPKNDFHYGAHLPSWIWKILILLSNAHPLSGFFLHLWTKFDRNRIIRGWDVLLKLFSKWRPSVILNFRKLSFCSRDLYLHVILHFHSEFRAAI